jgi:hypothetical protein
MTRCAHCTVAVGEPCRGEEIPVFCRPEYERVRVRDDVELVPSSSGRTTVIVDYGPIVATPCGGCPGSSYFT